jgi:aryl-phospho-beta-D-glucosidase BglC (GH1 family)
MVTVSNNGTVHSGAITIALSGANADAFELTHTLFGSGLAMGASRDDLGVRPRTGLAIGTYNATVTLSGTGGMVPQSFNVRFEVTTDQVIGTRNVIYRMSDDHDIHLFGGLWESGGVSIHPLLASNGGIRNLDLNATPPTITIPGPAHTANNPRTGTSQGVDFRLAALNARPNHHYIFEVTGRVTSGAGPHEVWIRNVSGTVVDYARNNTVANNTNFTLTTNPIPTATINATELLRFGGASAQTLEVRGIVVTAVCPAGCTCTPLFTRAPVTHTPFRNINAATLVGEIGIGWNLGNTLDAHLSENPSAPLASRPASHQNYNNPAAVETIWQGGRANRTTQELITAVKNAGFNAIRIPVTWYKATGGAPGYTIDPRWMNHVQTIVDMAVREDMYIILNTHHEEYLLRDSWTNITQGEQIITALWTQIADRFGHYNEKLIFEGLNEPRQRTNAWDQSTPGSPGPAWNWQGNASLHTVVNRLNQAFVNAVRGTATRSSNPRPNNAGRVLMLATYGAQGIAVPLAGFTPPSDPISGNGVSRFAMSVHIYSPHGWAHDSTEGSAYTSGHTNTISDDLIRVGNRAHGVGMPAVMGEWGTVAVHTTTNRANHAYDFTRAAADLQHRSSNPVVMRTVVWDTGRRNDDNSRTRGFFLIDRRPVNSGSVSPFIHVDSQRIINFMLAGSRRQARPS